MGPLFGAALLHYVRSIMARPANGLITNFNVSIFVLAAELRPIKIAYTYLNGRSSTLQRELTDVPPSHYENLLEKCSEFESELRDLKETMQPNVDLSQIKTALRRFERHEAQLQLQYEEKLFTLERKMADLVRRPSVVSADSGAGISDVAGSIALLPFKAVWTFVTVPARLLSYTNTLLHRKRIL